ncbi:MAG: hypothetical protein SH818_00885 [Saprospiraceae bacterium]|nr:hypothetical protein [Saprospiraceae bacterium]
MSSVLGPVKLSVWRAFLQSKGCEQIASKQHEKWQKTGLKRPVIFPTHNQNKKEIHPFLIRINLRTLEVSVEEFLEFIRDH